MLTRALSISTGKSNTRKLLNKYTNAQIKKMSKCTPKNEIILKQNSFGSTIDHKEVTRYTLTNPKNKFQVQLLSYGATISSISFPDKKGIIHDVVMGYYDMEGYLNKNNHYFGACIGRCANRIHQSKFKIGKEEYTVSSNEGENQLHGGKHGFDTKNFSSYAKSNSRVVMSYLSKDFEEGYPGDLLLNITFELTTTNELKMDFLATTTKPTIVNLTNHSYFNLAAHDHGDISEHLVKFYADQVLQYKENSCIPNGCAFDVKDTPFDFTTLTHLKSALDKVGAGGFDHFFVTRKNSGLNCIALVEHHKSGRTLEVYSDQPGFQFYTGNFIVKHEGKGFYNRQGAFCIEPHVHPNAVNQKNFPNVILYPGEMYKSTIVYKFTYTQR